MNTKIKIIKTNYQAGFESHAHSHHEAQLIYPSQGVMRFETEAGHWIVPPMRSCWLPANVTHTVRTRAYLEMHSVYCSGEILLSRLPQQCVMIPVSGLLRELILALEPSNDEATSFSDEHRATLAIALTDQIELLGKQSTSPLHLPSLKGTVLAAIELHLQQNPSDKKSAEEWASALNMSVKTLSRAFTRIAGMPFTTYRAQFKVFHAIELLAAGQSATSTAYELAFSSASSFGRQFKTITGQTPNSYFRQS